VLDDAHKSLKNRVQRPTAKLRDMQDAIARTGKTRFLDKKKFFLIFRVLRFLKFFSFLCKVQSDMSDAREHFTFTCIQLKYSIIT